MGQLVEGGKAIEGNYSQNGMGGTFRLVHKGPAKVVRIAPSAAIPADFVGIWDGVFQLAASKSKLTVTLANLGLDNSEGTWGLPGIGFAAPLANIVQRAGVITFDIPAMDAKFGGSLDRATGRLEGTYTKGAESQKISLERTGIPGAVELPAKPGVKPDVKQEATPAPAAKTVPAR
jgi:hypothetical protein